MKALSVLELSLEIITQPPKPAGAANPNSTSQRFDSHRSSNNIATSLPASPALKLRINDAMAEPRLSVFNLIQMVQRLVRIAVDVFKDSHCNSTA